MNFLTVSLSDEDRARIDRLAAALEVIGGSLFSSAVEGRPTEVVQPEPAPAPVPAPAAEVVSPAAHPVVDPFPAPAEAAPAAPAAPAPISLAEFQKRLTLLCDDSPEKKDRVRAVINEYAPAASAVPEDKRAEILARLASV